MERRFVIFLVLSFGILLGYYWLMQRVHPPRPRPPQEQAARQLAQKPKPPAAAQQEKPPKASEKPRAEKSAAQPQQAAPVAQAAAEPEGPEQWVTLGSVDDDQQKNPYRMLVTLDSRGAAVARIELSSPRYCDIDNRSGYLGHLIMDDSVRKDGCRVDVVGPGSPAAEAGLRPGDVVKAIGGKPVYDRESLEVVLAKTKPKQTVKLEVIRAGKEETLSAKLRRYPLEVIKPEGDDPLSMLMTLQQFDQQRLVDRKGNEPNDQDKKDSGKEKVDVEEQERLRDVSVRRELDGVRLRTANWKIVAAGQTFAQFRRALPEKGLEITKSYRLAKVPERSLADGDFPAYHLEFEIEIRNVGREAHKVAYRLDGPNGLPTEGSWYATRVTRSGGSGVRDFIISFAGGTPGMVGATTVAGAKPLPHWPDEPSAPLTFIGVDAQYFSAVLLPQHENPSDVWFDELMPIRAGRAQSQPPLHVGKTAQQANLTNTSCRLIGLAQEIKPGGALVNRFKFFAGPKKAAILENSEYHLGELIYFGWPIFEWVALPLTWILHGFFAVVHNYGLAIILLTVLVRGCMFPLSRKQALGAQKMQELQPEIKKIQEKFKNNVEGRTKAQQELFRKHDYNPLSGCLPIFIQLPVFIGLYRALMIAIELRDAPLISHSIRWCSNLAAPDMLFDWHNSVPVFVIGWLGPYFNLLPLLTIALFLWQQKMFMPPPADEQAAMQQKIMQYMMIFMGVMFFKVASGLCIYFIASSLWGVAERKFLPKTTPATAGGEETRAQAKARARQAAEAALAKKNRAKK